MAATDAARPVRSNPWAVGLVLFAGLMLVANGILMVFQGIVALVNDEFYVVARNYTFDFDITGWGWIHLGLGVIALFVGAGVMSGNFIARMVAIFVVVLLMVDNFLFIPYYPFWSLLLIAFNVAILWALATSPADD